MELSQTLGRESLPSQVLRDVLYVLAREDRYRNSAVGKLYLCSCGGIFPLLSECLSSLASLIQISYFLCNRSRLSSQILENVSHKGLILSITWAIKITRRIPAWPWVIKPKVVFYFAAVSKVIWQINYQLSIHYRMHEWIWIPSRIHLPCWWILENIFCLRQLHERSTIESVTQFLKRKRPLMLNPDWRGEFTYKKMSSFRANSLLDQESMSVTSQVELNSLKWYCH